MLAGYLSGRIHLYPELSVRVGGISGGTVKYPIRRYPHMAITDSAIRAARAKEKPYKLYDDEGLFMLVAAKVELNGATRAKSN